MISIYIYITIVFPSVSPQAVHCAQKQSALTAEARLGSAEAAASGSQAGKVTGTVLSMANQPEIYLFIVDLPIKNGGYPAKNDRFLAGERR